MKEVILIDYAFYFVVFEHLKISEIVKNTSLLVAL